MKIIIIFVILAIGIFSTFLRSKEDGHQNAITIIIGIIATIALSIVSSFLYDGINSLLSKPSDSTSVIEINDESKSNTEYGFDNNKSYMEDNNDVQHNNPTNSPEPMEYQNYIEDVSDKVSFSGSLIAENQKDTYRYIPLISGTYRFDTNLSSGGSVIIRISDENKGSIDYNYDALTINLEAGKTYMLGVEYRNGACDYTVNIGVPISINDISGAPSISGSITYQDQKDKYYYTAPFSGTYRFDTNLSSGGSVIVRVSGENGKSIDYNYDALSIDLEEGKKYILSTEYRNGICDYTVNIGVPIPISDISDNPSSITGSITYRDQKDKYYYTAPVTGTYRFDTNLSSGGSVIVRISGENGKSIDYNYDALTINLEAGKKYIISIEYRDNTCDYIINTGVPIPITDITGSPSISGNITYQDQKDRYYYTAPITGTYHFDTNLSSGGTVIVRISGENSKSISYDYDSLTINLEAGKLYILSIEYRRDYCYYETFIKTP